MLKTASGGALLALAALVLVGFGPALGLGAFRAVLTGLAVGSVLGCVPHGHVRVAPDRLISTGSTAARTLGWLGGLAAAGAGFLVWLHLLPDTNWARALVVAIVVLVVTGAAGLSGGRVPLWSLVLGAVSLLVVGPGPAGVDGVSSGQVTALTTFAVAVALGLLIGSASQWVTPGAPGDGVAVPEFLRRHRKEAPGRPIPGPRRSPVGESMQEQA